MSERAKARSFSRVSELRGEREREKKKVVGNPESVDGPRHLGTWKQDAWSCEMARGGISLATPAHPLLIGNPTSQPHACTGIGERVRVYQNPKNRQTKSALAPAITRTRETVKPLSTDSDKIYENREPIGWSEGAKQARSKSKSNNRKRIESLGWYTPLAHRTPQQMV